MATNFSPCKGSYVLNQFPSNVMFGMNGFHLSASGAIQGHHGPLVFFFFFFFFFLGGGGVSKNIRGIARKNMSRFYCLGIPVVER